MLPRLLDRLERRLKIPLIVDRIKHTEDVDPHLRRLLNKGLHHIIRVVAIGHQDSAPAKASERASWASPS